mmetsp:Transcript_51597/g.95490  ORF Transcript_51597/g.95490 Transcript_51597/m.95490 type:complete len:391 (-) Transcript_51597:180-1352(-)
MALAVANRPPLHQPGQHAEASERALVQFRLSLGNTDDLQHLLRLLAKVPLFVDTSDVFRESIAKAASPVEYSAGDLLLHQGEPSTWMGIVLRGILDVIEAGKRVAEVRPGGTFGDISLLGLLDTSTATVRARRATLLLQLDRLAFNRIVESHQAAEKLPIITGGLALREQMASSSTICNLKCFQRLERPMVQELFEWMEPRLLFEGTVLMKEGHFGEEMYFLQSGGVKVEKKNELLGHLTSGDVFGELAVLGSDKRRRATITVTCLSLVYVLRGEVFTRTLQKYPKSQRHFDHEYIRRVLDFDLDLLKEERSRLDSFHGCAHPKSTLELYDFCKKNTRLDMEFLNSSWFASRRAGSALGSPRRSQRASTPGPLPPRPHSEPLPRLRGQTT